MRLAQQHLTFRFALGASNACLVGENPTSSVPALLYTGMRGSMVIRLRLCMILSTPPHPHPTPPWFHPKLIGGVLSFVEHLEYARQPPPDGAGADHPGEKAPAKAAERNGRGKQRSKGGVVSTVAAAAAIATAAVAAATQYIYTPWTERSIRIVLPLIVASGRRSIYA